MTRKHFIAIADAVGEFLAHENDEVRIAVMTRFTPLLAVTLHGFNSSFDGDRFVSRIEEVMDSNTP